MHCQRLAGIVLGLGTAAAVLTACRGGSAETTNPAASTPAPGVGTSVGATDVTVDVDGRPAGIDGANASCSRMDSVLVFSTGAAGGSVEVMVDASLTSVSSVTLAGGQVPGGLVFNPSLGGGSGTVTRTGDRFEIVGTGVPAANLGGTPVPYRIAMTCPGIG